MPLCHYKAIIGRCEVPDVFNVQREFGLASLKNQVVNQSTNSREEGSDGERIESQGQPPGCP